jgi:DNA-binding MarR family transcriptional regulator
MEEETILTHLLGSTPKVKIIDLLLIGKELDYSITDMAEAAGVGRATIYRMLDDMLKKEIIKKTRKLGRIQLYQINMKNPSVAVLWEMLKKLMKIYSEKEIERQTMKVKVKSR